MDGRQCPAHGDGRILLGQRADGEDVAQGLGHLLALGGHPRVVDPQARELPAGAVGLGLLVLVVREAQVDAAAVDVEFVAEVAPRHGRAFEVPAGSAAPPGAVPRGRGRLAGLGGLPEGEVAGVALADLDGFVDLSVVLGGAHVDQALAGERPVVGLGVDVEVDVAAPIRIGVTGVDEALDEVDLVGDVAGGARLVGGGLNAEGLVCLREFALEAVCPGPPVPAGLGRLGEDLVVDVGDVADVGDLVAAAAQPADERVEGDGGAQVADVRGALHGGATQVDADLAGGDRVQGLDAGALGVVQVQHGINPTWQGGEAKETGASREYVTRPGPRPRNRAGSQVGARASSSQGKLRRRGARARG